MCIGRRKAREKEMSLVGAAESSQAMQSCEQEVSCSNDNFLFSYCSLTLFLECHMFTVASLVIHPTLYHVISFFLLTTGTVF
jgi:hypothetical protein